MELCRINRLKWMESQDTEKAFRVQQGDKEPVWIPKSQCEAVSRNKQHGEISFTIPLWLAENKQLDE